MFFNLSFKRIVSLFIIAIMIASTCCVSAFAQYGEKYCPGVEKCYGKCGSTRCQIVKVRKIEVYFPPKKCKTIAKRVKKCKKVSVFLDRLTSFDDIKSIKVGKGAKTLKIIKKSKIIKKPSYLDVIVTAVSQYGHKVNKDYKIFKKAAKKKKGVYMSYEFVVTKITSCSTYRKFNSKITIIKKKKNTKKKSKKK